MFEVEAAKEPMIPDRDRKAIELAVEGFRSRLEHAYVLGMIEGMSRATTEAAQLKVKYGR